MPKRHKPDDESANDYRKQNTHPNNVFYSVTVNESKGHKTPMFVKYPSVFNAAAKDKRMVGGPLSGLFYVPKKPQRHHKFDIKIADRVWENSEHPNETVTVKPYERIRNSPDTKLFFKCIDVLSTRLYYSKDVFKLNAKLPRRSLDTDGKRN